MAAALRPEQAITVGVRPSDVRLVQEAGGDAYDAAVEVTEYLGTEALLNLKVGGHDLVAQVPAAQRPPQDRQAVRIAFDPSHLHVFDTQSGQAIRA